MKVITEKTLAYTLSASLLIASLLIAMTGYYNRQQDEKLRTTKVDVLREWVLEVQPGQTYYPGDTVTATSSFTKLLNVKGQAERSVQCVRLEYTEEVLLNSANKDYKIPDKYWDGRVPSSKSSGTSGVTKNGNSIVNVGVPLSIGRLPNMCRVYITVVYNVNKYNMAFTETAVSNPFRVEQRPGLITPEPAQTFIYTDESTPNPQQSSISLIPSNGGQQVIIYQNTPSAVTEEASPPTVDTQPSVLNRATNTVQNILNRIGL